MRQKEVNQVIEEAIVGEANTYAMPHEEDYITAPQYVAKECKLNGNTKRRWVDKLLSGEYKQGASYLKRTFNNQTEYCCLGVLSEQKRELKAEVLEYWYDDDAQETVYLHKESLSDSMPPNEDDFDMDGYWHGLPLAVQQGLADANDKGATFKQIAKWIEENL